MNNDMRKFGDYSRHSEKKSDLPKNAILKLSRLNFFPQATSCWIEMDVAYVEKNWRGDSKNAY